MLLVLTLSNCKKDSQLFDPTNPEFEEFFANAVDSVKDHILDSVVNLALALPPQPPIVPTPELLSEETNYENDSIYCITKKYKWAPGEEEPLLMDPGADVIYPGSLLRAESITEGAYTPIIAPRKPILISISSTNINGLPTDTIHDPSRLSSAQEALQRLLSRELTGNGAAGHTKVVEKVYSYAQCKVALGANYSGGSFDVSSAFDYTNSSIKSRYMVKFFQQYYSISVDKPAQPSDFFSETPSPSILGSWSPVYVSSVKYGRVLLFLLESEKTESEMNAEVEASFNGLVASGGVNASIHLERLQEKTTMKVFVVGGNAQDAVAINSPDDVENYITQGGNFSSQSPGVPIAYTLRFLKDNSVAKVVQSSEYTVRSCEVIPATPFEITPSGDYAWPAQHVNGDGEYGGDGYPLITPKVRLYVHNNREIRAHINITFLENRHDYTTGLIDEHVHLGTIPAGYKFVRFVTPDTWQWFYAEPEGDHGPNTFTEGTPLASWGEGELVNTFVVNGDTGGDDLPCDHVGDDRSWAKIIFNKIVVSMRQEQ